MAYHLPKCPSIRSHVKKRRFFLHESVCHVKKFRFFLHEAWCHVKNFRFFFTWDQLSCKEKGWFFAWIRYFSKKTGLIQFIWKMRVWYRLDAPTVPKPGKNGSFIFWRELRKLPARRFSLWRVFLHWWKSIKCFWGKYWRRHTVMIYWIVYSILLILKLSI